MFLIPKIKLHSYKTCTRLLKTKPYYINIKPKLFRLDWVGFHGYMANRHPKYNKYNRLNQWLSWLENKFSKTIPTPQTGRSSPSVGEFGYSVTLRPARDCRTTYFLKLEFILCFFSKN